MDTPTSSRTVDLLKGWNFAPRLVGIARGAVEVAALAGIAFLGNQLGEAASWFPALDDPTKVSTFMLVGMGVIRWLESEADQLIDPQQNRTAETRAANPPN